MSKKKKKINYKKKKSPKKHYKTLKNKNVNFNNKNIKNNKINNTNKTNNTSKTNNNHSIKNINSLKPKEKKYHPTKIIIISIIFIFFLILTILFIFKKNLNLVLIGNNEETIEVFNEYSDPGYTATLFNKNINNLVKTSSNLNTNILGTYKITYKVLFLGITKTSRKINVIDSKPPTITLIGNEYINIYIGDEYIDEGVEILDNYDKDLSNNLVIKNNLDTSKKGTYTITYTVTDSSNNTSSITRIINVLEKKIINQNTNNACNLANSIEKYICQNNYNISVGYYNLINGKSYYYKADKLYYGASLIKTLDALYLKEKLLII